MAIQQNPNRFLAGIRNLGSTFLGRTGTPSPYLLPEEQDAALDQRRMAMAASLLQSAAPRPQGTGPGVFGALGGALQAGQQAQSASVEDAIRMRMLQHQMRQLNQGEAQPADVRTLIAAGIDPASPEGRDILVKSLNGGNGVSDQLALIQAQLGIDSRRDQIARDRVTDARTAEEERVKREQVGGTLLRGIEQTSELANLNTKLDGTFLQAGLPASSWRRTGASVASGLGSAIGMDTRALDQDLRNFDVLKKGLSDQLINLMSSGDLGQGTNSKLQQYQNALATTETSPGAIMEIQGKIAQTLLDEADAQKVSVPNRAQIEASIKKWHEYETKPGEAVVNGPAVVASVREIGQMTAAQLEALASKAGELTNEMREAAAKRWDELHAR